MSKCKAVLNIAGEHFPCDWNIHPHDGWAHQNREAEAIWVGEEPHLNLPEQK